MLLRSLRRRVIVGPVLASFAFASIAEPVAAATRPTRVRPDYQAARATLQAYLRHLEASQRTIDRSPFDLAAKARALGSDPGRIFAFVRDEVRFEAYAGALRGAQGTLEGLAGNAVDKSLLLAALLRAAGARDVRIVTGNLAAARRRELIAQMFRSPAPFNVPADEIDLDSIGDGLARVFGLNPSEVRQAVVDQALTQRSLKSALLELAWGDAALVADALESVDSTVLGRPIVNHDSLANEIGRHVWVVYTDAAGRTVSLDPSFAAAQPGARFAEAADTLSAAGEAALHQKASLRLVVERLRDGKIERDVLWDSVFTAEQLARSTVRYAVVPSEVDAEGVVAGRVSREQLEAQMRRAEGFQPVFWINGTARPGYPFDLHGERREVRSGRLAPFDRLASALEIAFGTAPAPGVLGGVRLEVEVSPAQGFGGAARVYARSLVDRIAPASRLTPGAAALDPAEQDTSGLALRVLATGELTVTTFVRSRARITAEVADQIVRSAPALEAALAAAFGQPLPPGETLRSVPPNRSARTEAWTLLVEAGAAGQPYLADEVRAYYAEPRVALFREQTVRGGDGSVALTREYDIVGNPLRVVHNPADAGNGARARGFALKQGAFETVAEAWLMGGPNVVNAHNVTGAALEAGIPLAVIPPGRTQDLNAVTASPRAKGNLTADLRAGYTVVVPQRPADLAGAGHTSWWRYDPRGGTLLGIGENGAGQGAVEYLQTSRIISGALIGMPIGWLVCAYVHPAGAQRMSCMQLSMISELATALALLVVLPIAGPWIGLTLVYGLGLALVAHGLLSGDAMTTDIGIGLVTTVAGFAIFDEFLSPLLGPYLARVAARIRNAIGGLPAYRLVPAVAGEGLGGIGRWPSRAGMGHVLFAMGQSSGGRQVRAMTGREFERLLAGALREGPGGHITRPTNALVGALPRMERVIVGQFNNAGHGVDLFGIDRQGRLWIMEAKWSNEFFGPAVRLGESVQYAGGGFQMGRTWRSVAAQSLAATAEGPARLRQLYNLGADVSDARVIEIFTQDVQRARVAVLVPDDAYHRLVTNFPPPSRDFDLRWDRDVYSIDFIP